MAKKSHKVEDGVEEDRELEKHLYPSVRKFFIEKGCEKSHTGDAIKSPQEISIFGGKRKPDVYGCNERNELLYLAEGKLNFSGSNFDICKGQGISCQRFGDRVYLFFSKEAWRSLDDSDQEKIKEECKNLGLGLLIVDKNETSKSVKEIIEPTEDNKLLDESLKEEFREKIYSFFPSFETPAHEKFLDSFSRTASGMCIEGRKLLRDLRDNSRFGKVFSGKSWDPESWEDDDDFYMGWKYEDNDKNLLYNLLFYPFGRKKFGIVEPGLYLDTSFDYEADKPEKFIYKRLKGKWKKNFIWNFEKQLKDLFKSDEGSTYVELWKIEEGEWKRLTGELLDKRNRLKMINRIINEELSFSILIQIEILGVEKRKIFNRLDWWSEKIENLTTEAFSK